MARSLSGGRLLNKNPKEAIEFLTSMVVMTRYEEFRTKEKNTTQASSEAKDEVGQA